MAPPGLSTSRGPRDDRAMAGRARSQRRPSGALEGLSRPAQKGGRRGAAAGAGRPGPRRLQPGPGPGQSGQTPVRAGEIGRASCRERGEVGGGAGCVKEKGGGGGGTAGAATRDGGGCGKTTRRGQRE